MMEPADKKKGFAAMIMGKPMPDDPAKDKEAPFDDAIDELFDAIENKDRTAAKDALRAAFQYLESEEPPEDDGADDGASEGDTKGAFSRGGMIKSRC